MKRWMLRPVKPILWIVVGIEVSYLWGIMQPIDPALLRMLKKQPAPETVSSSAGDLFFSLSMRSYSRDSESTSYVSADGVGVSFTESAFPSSNIAKHAFEEKLQTAIRVIECVPLINGRGRLVGTRVVAMFPTKYKDIESAGICWTRENGVYSVESGSLPHALKFEKSFRERFPDS